jgi:hypothetical protein
MPRPPIVITNPNDAVKMIRHDNVLIGLNVRQMGRYRCPAFFNNFTDPIQLHLAFTDLSKQTAMVLGAYGYEVCTGAGVVIILQSQ